MRAPSSFPSAILASRHSPSVFGARRPVLQPRARRSRAAASRPTHQATIDSGVHPWPSRLVVQASRPLRGCEDTPDSGKARHHHPRRGRHRHRQDHDLGAVVFEHIGRSCSPQCRHHETLAGQEAGGRTSRDVRRGLWSGRWQTAPVVRARLPRWPPSTRSGSRPPGVGLRWCPAAPWPPVCRAPFPPRADAPPRAAARSRPCSRPGWRVGPVPADPNEPVAHRS